MRLHSTTDAIIILLLFFSIFIVCTVVFFSTSLGGFVNFGVDYVIGANATLFTSEIADLQPEQPSSFDTCRLPDYDPWDDSVLPYVNQDYNPLKNCNHSFKPMTTLNNGIIKISEENVSCWGRCLERQSDNSNKPGTWMNVEKAKFQCDIVQTKCKDAEGKEIYEMVHAQIIEKNESKVYSKKEDGSLYSVYVILLDSHSYTQGIRNLPQTLHFFEKSMQAVSFPYVNKVGGNSRPNGVALWFGKRMEKVHRKLYGLPDVETDWGIESICHRYVDNETFIFKEFSAHGYKTMLAEDWMLGLLNWPNCLGFRNQPTDHYMRPFQVALEKEPSSLLSSTYSRFNCIEMHQDILGYMQDFINSYDGIPKFGWIWLGSLGHDHASGSIHADADFQRFLLRNKKKLDDSFFVIMGDHGMRGGSITSTKLGSVEINNAMFSISVPKKLRRSTTILSTLQENAKSLQTMFDIRATLIDILKYQPKVNFADRQYRVIEGQHGTSLLRNQGAAERTCKSLLIPLVYCMCKHPMKEIERTTDTAIAAGNFLVEHINAIIKENNVSHICEMLKFKHTMSMSAYAPENATRTYELTVKVQPPCNGEFKAIVRREAGKFEICSPSVERLDHFGSNGYCIDDTLKKLCHCKALTTKKTMKKR